MYIKNLVAACVVDTFSETGAVVSDAAGAELNNTVKCTARDSSAIGFVG